VARPLTSSIGFNSEINAALADPKFNARIADLGGAVFAGSPADFGVFIANEIEKWGKPRLGAVYHKPRYAESVHRA
jgi:hypothetical protein